MRDRKSTHRGRVFSLSQRLNRWLFGIKRRRCSLHLTYFSLSTLSLSNHHLNHAGEKFSSWAEASEFAKTIEGEWTGERESSI